MKRKRRSRRAILKRQSEVKSAMDLLRKPVPRGSFAHQTKEDKLRRIRKREFDAEEKEW